VQVDMDVAKDQVAFKDAAAGCAFVS
jgi:hypothetical protein